MPPPTFAPGWRFSTLDGVVLVVGLVASVAFGVVYWPVGFVIGFSLLHFFLFCNVFRLARALELAWSVVFVGLCAGTIVYDWPGWGWAVAGSLGMTVVVVAVELRKPSYHGVGWRVVNPQLPSWWSSHSS
jgi:hypothetical protein